MQRVLWHGLVGLSLASIAAGCGTKSHMLATTPILVPTGASNSGAVEVTLSGSAPARTVRAVVSDVAAYRVSLTGNGLAQPLVKQCLTPTNSSGKVSIRYDSLAPGTYTMTVEALDASGNVLGSDTQSGSVTAGICTYIDLHIKLAPTLVDNPNGSLGARITVTSGEVTQRPIANCPANEGFTPIDGSVCPAPSPSAPH
jgi:hypothetical protein